MLLATLIFFAQVRPKGPPPAAAAGALLVPLAILCASLVIAIPLVTIGIMHLIAMYKALTAVRKRNRTMEPGMVFLVFVPMLGFIWNFFIVIRVAESLRNEFEDRGWDTEGEAFGYGTGLTAVILNLACCAPVGVIFMVIHWRQVAAYTRQLLDDKRRQALT